MSYFNENLILWTDFRKIFNNISWKSIQCEPIYSMRRDRRTGGHD